MCFGSYDSPPIDSGYNADSACELEPGRSISTTAVTLSDVLGKGMLSNVLPALPELDTEDDTEEDGAVDGDRKRLSIDMNALERGMAATELAKQDDGQERHSECLGEAGMSNEKPAANAELFGWGNEGDKLEAAAGAVWFAAALNADEHEHGKVRVKTRSMTLGTEETASPSSRRVSAESTPPVASGFEHEQEGVTVVAPKGGSSTEQNDEAESDEAVLDNAKVDKAGVNEEQGPLSEIMTHSELNAPPLAALSTALPKTPSPPSCKTGQAMRTPAPSPADSTDLFKDLPGGIHCVVSGTTYGDPALDVGAVEAWDRSVAAVVSLPLQTADGSEEDGEEEGVKPALTLEVRFCQYGVVVLVKLIYFARYGSTRFLRAPLGSRTSQLLATLSGFNC